MNEDSASTSTNISRRRFLRLFGFGMLSAGFGAMGSWAYVTEVEPYMVEVTRVSIPLRNLTPAFAGFTLAQISDIHLGVWMTREHLLSIVGMVNDLRADLIVVTGDFVTHIWPDTPGIITEILSALRAPEGVIAILGNHDHWTHAPTVAGAIEQSPTRLLRNHHVALERGEERLYVAGVDDIWEEHHDLSAALEGVPDDAALILLAHEPDFADEVALDGRVGLQLSGHTHGGQVRVPGRGPIALPYLGRKYTDGLYEVNGLPLYVNRGVGMVAPHVRFNCRPEITLFTLVAE